MSTIAVPYTTQRRGFPAGLIIVVLLVAATIVYGVQSIVTMPAQIVEPTDAEIIAMRTGIVTLYGSYQVGGLTVHKTSDHADAKHPEAEAVRQACQRNGVMDYYLEPQTGAIHLLCKMDNGQIGDLVTVVNEQSKLLCEKTAHIRGVIDIALRAMVKKAAQKIGIEFILALMG